MAKRVLQMVLTLFVFMTIVFLILQAQPGDISNIYLASPNIPPEAKQALQERLGLDQPLHIQYLNYLRNVLTGNLGVSFSDYPRPVWDIIVERLPRTFVLFMVATLTYYFFGFKLGKLIAWRRGGVIDYGATISGVILFTAYTPWFALLLLWIFSSKLGWFPRGKFLDPLLWRHFDISANSVFGLIITIGLAIFALLTAIYIAQRKLRLRPLTKIGLNLLSVAIILAVLVPLALQTDIGTLALDILWHLVLPVTTILLIGFGGAMLIMRDSMLDVIKEDYVLAARAKGLPSKVVRDRHAARNALLPVLTSFVLALAFTVDGGIITETVFSWPGMGLTLINAVGNQDIPLAVGVFVFTGIFALIAHLIADVLYAYLDPRIRYD